MKPSGTDINKMLGELAHSSFYGAIEIKLEAGRVVLIRITENYKPPMERPRYAERND
jgi:hypothetical protein